MNEDKIIKEIIDLKEEVRDIREMMATKDDIRQIMSVLETLVTAVKKIQEDHVFAVEWLKRLQARVDQQDEEIRRIKLQLKMV